MTGTVPKPVTAAPPDRWRQVLDPRVPGSLPARARQRRWTEFRRRFPDIAQMHVLDLGGSASYWRAAPVRPASVTLVNTDPVTVDAPEPWIRSVVGDACEPVPGSYDLVVSNSLLEHVGGHERRARLADAVRAAADRHWVQTPYRYFPVEPHWNFPGMQWLPFRARVAVAQRWRLGHVRPGGNTKAVADVHEVELLSITEMRSYFPGSDLWLEKFAGLPKSMVAIRTRP